MVIREGVAVFILEENAGHVAGSEGVVVAVGRQGSAVERLEVLFIGVDLLEKGEAAEAFVAAFAVLGGIVVADHVDVEQVFDPGQRHQGVFDIITRTPEVGVFAGESDEIHVEWGFVRGIMRRQRDDGRRSGRVVVGAGVEYLPAQIADMVVMGRENVTAVVAPALYFGDHIE